jgi:ribonuclease HII
MLQPNLLEAGCDEAGRGCLAGPVVAAAVILPEGYSHPELNDSKQLSKKIREKLKIEIMNTATAWNVAFVDNNSIDELNILRASIKAMHLAIDGLAIKPQFILVDGSIFYSYKNISHKTVVKGDSIYYSIAAASVLAKTFRDEYMEKIHNEFPQYGWGKNKGYPTAAHRESIAKHGITPYHRKSFALLNTQMVLGFY